MARVDLCASCGSPGPFLTHRFTADTKPPRVAPIALARNALRKAGTAIIGARPVMAAAVFGFTTVEIYG
jgi:hypothetical protein